MMSPALTNSPSFIFHDAIPPWVIVGLRLGNGTTWCEGTAKVGSRIGWGWEIRRGKEGALLRSKQAGWLICRPSAWFAQSLADFLTRKRRRAFQLRVIGGVWMSGWT